jgi:PAS domain S-box-containing protein
VSASLGGRSGRGYIPCRGAPHTGHPRAYSSNEIRYLSLAAEQVALAVDNALRDEEQRRGELFLEEGQKLSHTGRWHWNLASGEIKWSREHFRILVVDPDYEKPSLALFWSRVHPGDCTLLEKAVDRAAHEKANFEEEYRIVVPDGTVKHIHGIGRAIVDESGDLIEFIGTTMDITERKCGEEELRRQKTHFERLFELAPEAIVLRDFENRILRANREFTELFGYTVEEALGRNINDLIVPDGSLNESEALRDAVKCGERVNAEVVRKRKDGSHLDVSFVAAPVAWRVTGQKFTESTGI